MNLHHAYLVALSLLFALALAITIVSLIAHRRAPGTSRAAFFTPTGGVQFVWAMIPIAILFAVDYALIDMPDQRRAPAPRLAIAVAAAPATAVPGGNQRSPGDSDARGRR